MLVLIKLILAHLLGDFLLQPKKWVLEKEKGIYKSPKLYIHALIHGILVMLLLWDLRMWLVALLVSLSHLLIDLIKLVFQKPDTKSRWFIIDQVLHLLSLLLLWCIFEGITIEWAVWLESEKLWVMLTAISFLTFGVAIIMHVMLNDWSGSLGEDPGISLHNAGKVIGILERLLVFVFILTDHWEGVGFLIAAKSVFRFGDLKESKDRKLTEYILVGTLVSFGLAIFTALVTQFYLQSLP
jgi:hypothetical protein